jgi:sugar fermentation stimulation protein A
MHALQESGNSEILYQSGPLEPALFLERPNRFTVLFQKGGRRGIAFLANPGRLQEILLPRTELLLARRPHTSLGWEVAGATWQERWPGDVPRTLFLNAARMNHVAETLLQNRRIPELADAHVVRREAVCGNSRFDFLLSRGGYPYLLEVKSVKLVEHGVALFPDAKTERGRRHLHHLARLAKKHRAGVLFLVQGESAAFLPDFHSDLEFARTFRSVQSRLDILAYSLTPTVTPDLRICFRGTPRRLEVPAKRLEPGISDRGVYLVAMHLAAGRAFEVGALGSRAFREGWYVYAGSAQRSLTRRVERHLRLRKKLHYHIDFLRAECTAAGAFPIRGTRPTECELAEEIHRISSDSVERFGCSDCRCGSHLFYFEDPPHRLPRFQEVLTRLRHQAALG